MLPKEHFDKIEKGAIDQISSTAKSITKEEPPSKKVVEIKENSLDKSAKVPTDVDDSQYDYYSDDMYDDDADNEEDIVTVKPKITSTTAAPAPTTSKCN